MEKESKDVILQKHINREKKGNTTQVQFLYDAIFEAMEDYAKTKIQSLKSELVEANLELKHLRPAFDNEHDLVQSCIEERKSWYDKIAQLEKEKTEMSIKLDDRDERVTQLKEENEKFIEKNQFIQVIDLDNAIRTVQQK